VVKMRRIPGAVPSQPGPPSLAERTLSSALKPPDFLGQLINATTITAGEQVPAPVAMNMQSHKLHNS